LGYEYAAILLIDEDGRSLIPFAVSDQGGGRAAAEEDKAFLASHHLKVGKGIVGWVAQHGESVCLGDVQKDPRYYGLRSGIHSELCVPLLLEGRVLGVINIETRRPNAYTELDRQILETVSRQIAVAIQNSRLYQQVQLDLMDRRRTQEVLAASEAELRALLASMQDVVLVIDHAGVYRKIAPTNPELLVRPPQELLGRSLHEIFSVEQADVFGRLIHQVLETGRTAQIEYALTIAGQERWFSTSVSAMSADSTLWVARDITASKRSQEKTREAEAKYRQLVERMPIVMYMDHPDESSSSIYISPQIESLLGYSSAEFGVDPRLWHRLIHPEDHARHGQHRNDVIPRTGCGGISHDDPRWAHDLGARYLAADP